MQRFSNKTILITGASSGIGLAGAKRLIAEGAHVIITGRTASRLNAAAAELGANATAILDDAADGNTFINNGYLNGWIGADAGETVRAVHIRFSRLLAALAVYGWPEYQHLLRDLYGLGGEKLNQTREEMSIFFKGNDEGFRLSLSNGLLLALVLVLTNGLHIAGLLIGALMVFSLNRRSTPVLERPQRWFLFGLLLLNCLIGAYLLLYTGHLFSDLVYMPAIMICLWLSSGGLFRLINRSYRDEQRLVIFWLAVAYALASIIVFGPSSVYLKEAGLAVRSRPEPLYSNSRQILYYAGRDPRNADFNIHFLPDGEIGPNALILYSHNRKEPLPDTLELYHILGKFSNRHGDQVFLLRLKDGQKN